MCLPLTLGLLFDRGASCKLQARELIHPTLEIGFGAAVPSLDVEGKKVHLQENASAKPCCAGICAESPRQKMESDGSAVPFHAR